MSIKSSLPIIIVEDDSDDQDMFRELIMASARGRRPRPAARVEIVRDPQGVPHADEALNRASVAGHCEIVNVFCGQLFAQVQHACHADDGGGRGVFFKAPAVTAPARIALRDYRHMA